MSMICVLSSISDESIDTICKHPLLVLKYFYDEEEFEDIAEEYKNSSKTGFLAKLFGKKNNNADSIPEHTLMNDEGIQTDLDKAWHGIHFLLNGSAYGGDAPLNFIAAGGKDIKGSGHGYESDHVFTSTQVKNIDNALQSITEDDFKSRYAPEKMMQKDIYPNIWDHPKEEDDTLDYITEYFIELKRYVHSIAEKNMGMLVGLS